MTKKKKYIREGGICQFWDNWAENGTIDYQKLGYAISHPESIESKDERSEESYIVEQISKDFKESTHEAKIEETTPFNREYKNYDKED